MNKNETAAINIEQIMQAIRQQIIAQKGATGDSDALINISGKNLSPDLYEHLYQAHLLHNQITPSLLITPPSIPIIGPFLQKIRLQLHQLVLFYINKTAANQIRVNHHLIQSLSLLAEEVERLHDQKNND